MRVNLWGIHPKTKKPSCFALGIDSSARTEYEARAREEGWTHLTIGPYDRLGTEPSASSASPSSPEPSATPSTTSAAASHAAGSASRPSQRRGPRPQ